jgi:hypothetical protein
VAEDAGDRIHPCVDGLLERLIEDACSDAIASGEERLTTGLLDGITISLGNLDRRDATVGEVPPVPARPRTPGLLT